MEQHQISNHTEPNRYPEVFKALTTLTNNPTILSYGCSTGDEIQSMLDYFSNCFITGYDCSEECMQICKNRFAENSNVKIENPQTKFDIVLAMSVFCRWPDSENLNNISDLYPFEKWDNAMTELVSFIKPGGLLVLYNSNYVFEDATVFNLFDIIDITTESGFVHKFNNLSNRREAYKHTIFRKK